MKYRRLGSSTLEVSVIAFGAWQIGDPRYWGDACEADGVRAVHAAIDAGVNLFDTAESYGQGESERMLGKALGGRRDRVLVASKVSPEHCVPGSLRRACEDSLDRLGTECIDLYQIHWPFREAPFAEVWEELDALRAEGKIRAVGVSNFGVIDLTAWLEVGECVSNQLGYNLAFRATEYEILPACRRREVGVLAYMPLLQGILTGQWKTANDVPQNRRRTRHFSPAREGVRHRETGCEELLFDALARLRGLADEVGLTPADLAMAWLIGQPGVASVIVGGRKPCQVSRNLAAADLVLDAPLMDRMSGITEPMKHALGANADLWQTGRDSRIR